MPCGGGFRSGLASLWAIAGQSNSEDDTFPHQDDVQTRCPDCGWKITEAFLWCPQCGNRLRPYQCDYCKGHIPKDAVDCPRCGAPVAKV